MKRLTSIACVLSSESLAYANRSIAQDFWFIGKAERSFQDAFTLEHEPRCRSILLRGSAQARHQREERHAHEHRRCLPLCFRRWGGWLQGELFGRGSLPERPQIEGVPGTEALAWERGEEVPEVAIDHLRKLNRRTTAHNAGQTEELEYHQRVPLEVAQGIRILASGGQMRAGEDIVDRGAGRRLMPGRVCQANDLSHQRPHGGEAPVHSDDLTGDS